MNRTVWSASGRRTAVVAAGVSLAALLAGCGTGGKQATKTETVTVPTVVTSVVTVTVTPTPSSSTATSSPTTTATSDYSTAANAAGIDRVDISLEDNSYRVGNDLFELPGYGSISIRPEWKAYENSVPANGSSCQVETLVTGPGGLSERRRSASCSGDVNDGISIKTAGAYHVTVSLIPAPGKPAVLGQKDFTVVNK